MVNQLIFVSKIKLLKFAMPTNNKSHGQLYAKICFLPKNNDV